MTDEKKERKEKRISQCYGCGQRPMRCDNSCTCKCARYDCKLVVGEEGLPLLMLEGGMPIFAFWVAGIAAVFVSQFLLVAKNKMAGDSPGTGDSQLMISLRYTHRFCGLI